MAEVKFVPILLCFCCVVCSVFGVIKKEYYCKDPETGILHPLNTTWPASNFCGNYTCKIKKRTQPADMDVHASNNHNTIVVPNDKNNDELVTTVSDNIANNNTETTTTTEVNKQESTQLIQGDRYLSEVEIKAISELLHMLKKSDLQAVAEVYNLAQDIYKEIENYSPKSNIKISANDVIRRLKADIKAPKSVYQKQNSYFYEPIYHNPAAKFRDLTPAGAEVNPVRPVYPYHYPGQSYSSPYGFQSKTPYYNPFSPSYSNYFYSQYSRNPGAGVDTPCNKYPCGENAEVGPRHTLLPFPYSNVRYNLSYLPYGYYRQEPQPYKPTVAPQVHVEPEVRNKAILDNPDLQRDFREIEQGVESSNQELDAKVQNKSDEDLPPWQTMPLSQEVLEDVRANVENTRHDKLLFKPLLRSKLRLERVAKVLKLDDITRKKREAVDVKEEGSTDEDLEPYIEKITCQYDTELGFFRVGNLTRPYPECCPQKVQDTEVLVTST